MSELSPKIRVDYSENITMVTITESKILDDNTITSIEGSIKPIVDDSNELRLIINFCNVQFLSSAMLGLLIRINKSVKEKGGQLRLCSINEKIQGIFRITRLDKVFQISEDSIKAKQAFE